MESTCECEHKAFDCGHTVHNKCYCDEDQGYGYTFNDEYGDCDFCRGLFSPGQIVGSDKSNSSVLCTCDIGRREIAGRLSER